MRRRTTSLTLLAVRVSVAVRLLPWAEATPKTLAGHSVHPIVTRGQSWQG